MINVFFNGSLGSDAEVKLSKNNKKFLTMRVATDDYSNGTRETVWTRVTCPPERFLNLEEYLKKGKPVMIAGTQRVTVYKNNNGDYGPSIDIMADHLEFISTGTKEGSDKPQESAKLMNTGTLEPTAEASQTSEEKAAAASQLDDLPF